MQKCKGGRSRSKRWISKEFITRGSWKVSGNFLDTVMGHFVIVSSGFQDLEYLFCNVCLWRVKFFHGLHPPTHLSGFTHWKACPRPGRRNKDAMKIPGSYLKGSSAREWKQGCSQQNSSCVKKNSPWNFVPIIPRGPIPILPYCHLRFNIFSSWRSLNLQILVSDKEEKGYSLEPFP